MSDTVYKVKIDQFEGPLDLLLHLVNQYQLIFMIFHLREIKTSMWIIFIRCKN